MQTQFKQLLSIVFFTGIGVFILWYIIHNMSNKDIGVVIQSFKDANYYYVFLAICTSLLSHVFRAWRWQQLLATVDKKPSIINATAAVGLAYFANLAFPRLGEVSRCGYLLKKENISIDKSFGTVILERIIDLITMLVFAIILMVWQSKYLYGIVEKNFLSKISINKIITFGIIAILMLALLFFGIKKNKKIVLQNKIVQLIIKKLSGFYNGLVAVKYVKNKGLFLFISIAIWALYVITAFINFKSLTITSNLGMAQALAIIVFGTFAFALVQGGIGAYQLIVMETLFIYGIPKASGFAMGWISWTSQTLLVVIMGLIALIIMQKKSAKN